MLLQTLGISKARQWCFDQFGDCVQFNPNRRWAEMGGDFWFLHEEDAFAFKLRWG